jgi:ABC-type nitrate/sulfonate/bicarbonate transport system substrate-binding protein
VFAGRERVNACSRSRLRHADFSNKRGTRAQLILCARAMRLGPYVMVRPLGAGGEVWVARRDGYGPAREPVVLRRLPPLHSLDAARRALQLRHPNLVRALELGDADGQPFLATQYVDGLDLARATELLAGQGERLPVVTIAVAVYIVTELLHGLACAHNLAPEPLIHGGVSPAKVLLSVAGEVELAGFGVPPPSGEDPPPEPGYLAPEQLRGDPWTPAVDLFAVGAILHELLDGEWVRGGAGEVPSLRRPHEIPIELERARRRLLALDPQGRPASAEDALELLLRWPGAEPQAAAVTALVQQLRDPDQVLLDFAADARERETRSPRLAVLDPGLDPDPDFEPEPEPDVHDLDLDVGSLGHLDPDALDEFTALEEVDEPAPRRRPRHASASVPGPVATSPNTPAHTRPDPIEIPRNPTHTDRSDRNARNDRNALDPGPSALALDLPPDDLVAPASRPAPLRPIPTTPARRPLWPLALVLVAIVGITAAVVVRFDLIPRPTDPSAEPAPVLRNAKLASRGSLVALGFHDPRFNGLVEADIFFDYQPSPGRDPLAALARGEVEFALTRIDPYLRANAPGTIIAVLGHTPAGEALVVRDLPDLRALTSPIATSPRSRPLADQLVAELGLSAAITEFPDDAAILAALVRPAPDDAEPELLRAAILREPELGQALAAGLRVQVAARARDLPLTTLELLIVRDELIAGDPERVATILASYFAATEALTSDPASARERAATALGFELDVPIPPEPDEPPDPRDHVALAEQAERVQARAEQAERAKQIERSLASSCRFDPSQAARYFEDDAALLRAALRHPPELRIAPRFVLDLAASKAPSAPATCPAAAPPRGRPTQALGPLAAAETLASSPFVPGEATLSGPITAIATALGRFNPATVTAELLVYPDEPGPAARKLALARADQLLDALTRAGVELPMTTALGDLSELEDIPAARVRVLLRRIP